MTLNTDLFLDTEDFSNAKKVLFKGRNNKEYKLLVQKIKDGDDKDIVIIIDTDDDEYAPISVIGINTMELPMHPDCDNEFQMVYPNDKNNSSFSNVVFQMNMDKTKEELSIAVDLFTQMEFPDVEMDKMGMKMLDADTGEIIEEYSAPTIQ